ncbi:hypothetical protein KHA80_14125 [Anaerobacillus sp. HL2]|nr:hypothetical protein KHA80_14125 [Anaerobacillus sp. HL2]
MATFRQLKSGKWQARVFKKKEKNSVLVHLGLKEAQIEAGKVEERIYYGQTLNDRNMLSGDVATEWLNEHKKVQ